MKPFYATILASIILSFPVFSQCNCHHTITAQNTGVNIIDGTSYSYAPGDTFCIQAGNISGLRFLNFVGTASDPLVFINCGGQVIIDETTYSGIAFNSSEHIQITGTGDPSIDYGFHVVHAGNGQMGVALGYLCSDFEVDNIEIEETGFAGIMAKTDPKCNDTATWRSNGYVFNNLHIHNNYIHDVEGEGMYIGYTGGYKVQSNVTCNGDYVFGHWLENVDIHDNLVVNAGWDGIQVNLVRSNGKIHDNRIINHGLEDVTFQNFAMSIGGGVYEIYNNYILVDPGHTGKGMQMISGESGCKLYNNVFINPQSHGIFVHNRHEFEDTTIGYVFANNTIIRPATSGIFLNTGVTQSLDTSKIGEQQNNVPSFFINNFIVDPGSDYASGNTWKDEQESYIDFNVKSTRDAQINNIHHNLLTRQMDTLELLDTTLNNFSPANASSPLVDAGADVSSYNVTFDIDNIGRPQFAAYDIGAYELSTQTNIPEQKFSYTIYPNPTHESINIIGVRTASTAELYDISGKLLKSIVFNPGQINTINISEFSRGQYVLHLDGHNVLIIKI